MAGTCSSVPRKTHPTRGRGSPGCDENADCVGWKQALPGATPGRAPDWGPPLARGSSSSWRSAVAAGWLLVLLKTTVCRDKPMYSGHSPPSCHLPSISTGSCCREPEKIPEKGDCSLAKVERRFSAKHSDFLEPKGCFASVVSCGRKVSSSSSVETGLHASESPGLARVCAHLDTAADSGQKSSSLHSDHSSETSLPDVHTNPEEFSLLKLQTEDGQRPEWTFYPRFSSNIHTYHVGKQCLFNGVFLSNRRSLAERTVDKSLGRKKYDIDPRNGIPALTPGDNPYVFPEQSKGFHKAGATLPPVNFALVPYEKKFDTFIPLEPLPQIPTCFGLSKTILSRNRPTKHALLHSASLVQLLCFDHDTGLN
ncbi:spermatogenesis-associated serine-rich protein 1 isoform X3 [Castor canadensis]|uniref:Spermatogenesis-associated serine-rich protein 1 isoform X3 n=1 Tax=Castor canadensis TaxID=51338 RepID=A0AC58N8Z2_CASCN